ncbi:unnamed protein product [Bodo saltans]|uniref:Uncharacterized protein n=1 Tax=Bodo saltans TaxID=75058 RepID=A0A0S4J426_BODSA|nr:unnamed protein product [Bodo saltans]|eukprot:CUG86014.1 unnamed protein product [Bodo saltans]
MAASSIDTYVDRYLSEHPMKGAWYIRSLTTAAHANSAPVNPRPTEWDEEALLNIVRSAASVGDELLLWTLLVTGARPADVERLTFQQVSIEEDCVRISWWLRKAQRTRRERHEETYSFRWAFPPSERVRDFFKGRPGTHGILPLEKCYQRGRIARVHSRDDLGDPDCSMQKALADLREEHPLPRRSPCYFLDELVTLSCPSSSMAFWGDRFRWRLAQARRKVSKKKK